MRSFFVGLDIDPRFQWNLGIGLIVFLFGVCFVAEFARVSRRECLAKWCSRLFCVSLLLILVYFRHFTAFWPTELGVDESQMIAQARKFLIDPMPWRSIDGTTSGPLNSYVLMLPALFGLDINYVSARWVGLILVGGMFMFLYLAARRITGRTSAMLGVIPVFLFFSFTLWIDFIHYTSEHLPLFLVALIIWLFVESAACGHKKPSLYLSAAVLAGCLPFSKIQVTPIAAYIFACGLGHIVCCGETNIYHRWRKGAALVLAALAFPLLTLAIVSYGGVLNDFWQSYVVAAIFYGSRAQMGLSVFNKLASHEAFLSLYEWMRIWVCGTILVLPIVVGIFGFARLHKPIAWLTLSIGLSVVTIFSILRPGTGFSHYLLLLSPGFILLSIISLEFFFLFLEGISRVPYQRFSLYIRFALSALFVGACFLFLIPKRNDWQSPAFPYFSAMQNNTPPQLPDPLLEKMKEMVEPGKKMAIWGWIPRLYIQLNVTPGTRDVIAQFQMQNGKNQPYYRKRFLEDLKESRAEFFLDIPRAFQDTSNGFPTFENFPELATYIRDNYRLIFIGGELEFGARLFQLAN